MEPVWDFLSLLVAVALGPLPHWAIGLAVLLAARQPSPRLLGAPLLGACIAGWLGIVGLAAGVSPQVLVSLVAGLAVAYLAFRRRELMEAKEAFVTHGTLYLFFVAALMVSPYPGLGHWSGDWLENVRMGELLRSLDYNDPTYIVRTPLFASGALFLHWITGPLAAYQINSAVVSASALMSLLYLGSALGRPLPRSMIYLFALLPFSLIHLQALWPKFLAAGCVVCAVAEAYKYRETGKFEASFWGAAWFAFGFATHVSTPLLFPLLAVVLWWRRRGLSPALVLRDCLVGAGIGLVLWGLFEGWASHHFSVDVRLNMYPNLRAQGEGVQVQTLVSHFIGYDLAGYVSSQIEEASNSGMKFLAAGFTFLSAWLHALAGTLVGLSLFFVVAGGRRFLRGLQTTLRQPLAYPLLATGLAGVVGASWVTTQIPYTGATQIGMTGLCFLLLYQFSQWVPWQEARFRRRLLATVWVGGLLPFIAMHVIVTGTLRIPSFGSKVLANLRASDSDIALMENYHLVPLSAHGFWIGLVLLAVMTVRLSRLVDHGEPQTQATQTSDPETFRRAG